MHSKGYVHRDVKPDNFVIGLGEVSDTIYIVDYGLSKSYISKSDGKHLPNCSDKKLSGTIRYASVNAHMGYEQSRRDDLESLGYTLIYFMKGRLPWQGLQGVDKSDRQERVFNAKVRTSLDDLCKGLPTDMLTYMYYCRSLSYEDTPAYRTLRREFKNYFKSKRMNIGFEFDWVKKAREQLQIASTDGLLRVSNKLAKREEEKKNNVRNLASGELIKLNLDNQKVEDNKNLLRLPLRRTLLSSNNGTNVTQQYKDSNDSCNFDLNEIKEAVDDILDENLFPKTIHIPVSKVKDNALRWKSRKLNTEASQIPKSTSREVSKSSPRFNTVGFMY